MSDDLTSYGTFHARNEYLLIGFQMKMYLWTDREQIGVIADDKLDWSSHVYYILTVLSAARPLKGSVQDRKESDCC